MDFLPTLWFIIIAVLWIGYLFLEGFDLGVGMLMKVFARGESQRRVLLNTVGPVWDGNEVWLLTAGGAIFAAFPYWYAVAVLRPVPAARAGAAGPDLPRRRLRVPRQGAPRVHPGRLGLGDRAGFLHRGFRRRRHAGRSPPRACR